MTPKEALEKLNHTICLNANGKNLKWNIDIDDHIDCVNVDEFCDCYEILDEVLTEYAQLKAKATPMKPIVEIDEGLKLKGYSKLDYTDYRCPRCKKYIGYRHYFCPEKECGQALDWGDEK